MTEETKTITLQISRKTSDLRKSLWTLKFDILLLISSATCFGLFLNRSLNYEQISGIGGPIAILSQGNAERKAAGSHVFVDVGPNSNLFNLDAIWVGKDNQASIKLENNVTLSLSEKTLMILKRPFKHKSSLSTTEEEIKIVKGAVIMPNGNSLFPAVENLSPLPKEEAPSKNEKNATIHLYPKDNSVIYMRPEKDIPLSFAWPDPLTGYIVIQDKFTGHKIYAEIQNQKSFTAKLEQPGSYFWQVIDSERRPMLGPYTFVMKHLDAEVAKQLLKSGVNSQTEVYW